MGCGSSKTTAVDTTGNHGNQQTATQSSPQTTADQTPAKKEKMPRGNILKYSKWLKRFHRLSKTDGAQPVDINEVNFPLQEGVDPEDLTPWRDEDTRIVCEKVKDRVDPYFWDFSGDAQRKADECFKESLARRCGGAFDCSPPDPNAMVPYGYYYEYQGPVPLNPDSVDEYFHSQLRHPVGRCYNCIQSYDMRFQFAGQAWEMLPDGVIKDDHCTEEQIQIHEKRAARQELNDPERMRKRRIQLIRRFLKLYSHNGEDVDIEENELQPWLGWADRMDDSWQKFQELLVVNSNEPKNTEIDALTKTFTFIK